MAKTREECNNSMRLESYDLCTFARQLYEINAEEIYDSITRAEAVMPRKVFAAGCGDSYCAALAAQEAFRKLTGMAEDAEKTTLYEIFPEISEETLSESETGIEVAFDYGDRHLRAEVRPAAADAGFEKFRFPDVTEEELAAMNGVISPLLRNGQSIYHILLNHRDEIPRCEKTVYSYVDSGLLDARNLNMPRKVRLRPRKGKKKEVKVDKKCRVGRTYEDFKAYRSQDPDLPVTEIDSVEGIKGGAALLTIHFVQPKLQLSFKSERNDSRSVTDIFNSLYETLGPGTYKKLFPLLLADNGSEFSNPSAIEKAPDGSIRSRLFYCDAASPGQKGHCENNHEMIRRIIPKGRDIGLYQDEQIRLMMDHINSYGRDDLNGKSPYEVFAFLYGEDVLEKLRVHCIPADSIVLKPSLLKEGCANGDN